MIHYPHFAVPDLYLVNGYHVHGSGDDMTYEFESETDLELCVARILIRRPARLHGWGLRFLRRAMGLTQAQFGERIDRDAQTVARLEKDADCVVEKNIDTIARLEFATRFEPGLSAAELNLVDKGMMDGATGPYYLQLEDGRWNFVGQCAGVQRLENFETEAYALEVMPQDFILGGITLTPYLHQCNFPMVMTRYDQGYVALPGEGADDGLQMALRFDSGLKRTINVSQAHNEFSYRVCH
jgi:DNA-binding XRE family transcriptional regulator